MLLQRMIEELAYHGQRVIDNKNSGINCFPLVWLQRADISSTMFDVPSLPNVLVLTGSVFSMPVAYF